MASIRDVWLKEENHNAHVPKTAKIDMHQFAERQMVSITGTNAFYEKMNADDKRELDTLKDLVKVR